jgi:hypothetical protein
MFTYTYAELETVSRVKRLTLHGVELLQLNEYVISPHSALPLLLVNAAIDTVTYVSLIVYYYCKGVEGGVMATVEQSLVVHPSIVIVKSSYK